MSGLGVKIPLFSELVSVSVEGAMTLGSFLHDVMVKMILAIRKFLKNIFIVYYLKALYESCKNSIIVLFIIGRELARNAE